MSQKRPVCRDKKQISGFLCLRAWAPGLTAKAPEGILEMMEMFKNYVLVMVA